MTLRKLLFIPLILSLILFVYFSHELRHSLMVLQATVHLSAGLVWTIFLAVCLQVVGHCIRAYKAKIIFGVAKESSTRFQFRALSIGYLFNTILPFRLGELLRARVVSGAMTISFGYALVLIVFERLVDALLLGIIGIAVLLISHHATERIMLYVATLCVISGVGLGFYSYVARQNTYVLKIWYGFTRLFNTRLETVLRFKAWTVIYGLQRTMRPRLLIRYFGLSVASWLFYLTSLYLLASYLIRQAAVGDLFKAAAAPYFGTSLPAGPASLGVFSRVVNNFLTSIHINPQTELIYNLAAWSILVIPIALIGMVLLLGKTKEMLRYEKPRSASSNSLANKLYRSEDISDEMQVFLENYFSGNGLSQIVHGMEVHDEFKLIKYFKGGSDAITILAMQDERQIVKKIIPIEFDDRLKAQYDWLLRQADTPGIVQALAEKHAKNYYSIDLAYDADNEMLFEYIHKNTLARSKQALASVWWILNNSIYKSVGELKLHPKERQAYIDKHIFGCLEKAAAIEPELARAATPEKIYLNGVEYDNLYQIMEKIKRHKIAWRDIATYRQSLAVHGDVIVDNLLVSKKTGDVLIIDPAPDGNIIQGPVFDFGKNMQSLYCGYEMLLRDEDPVYFTDGDSIEYRDQKSGKYEKLADYIRYELAAEQLTESEQKAILFHAAALYIRRLKHQVYYTPANVLKFYAVGVKTLNEFLAQYETED